MRRNDNVQWHPWGSDQCVYALPKIRSRCTEPACKRASIRTAQNPSHSDSDTAMAESCDCGLQSEWDRAMSKGFKLHIIHGTHPTMGDVAGCSSHGEGKSSMACIFWPGSRGAWRGCRRLALGFLVCFWSKIQEASGQQRPGPSPQGR